MVNRFCVALNHGAWRNGGSRAVARTLRTAEIADAIGFDSVWVSEDPDGWDAFALLAALAQRTDRIRLGTGVTNAYLRHPNLIAASVATLDKLSDGRAFLGLGRGQPEWYESPFGITIGDPLARLETTIDLLHQWWREPFTASSDVPPLVRDWERTVHPVESPPIFVAAVGPNALGMAGRKADGVLFNELATPMFVARAVRTVQDAARLAGRDPNNLSFFVNPAIHVSPDREDLLEKKKDFLALIVVLPGMEQLLENDQFDVPALMAKVREVMRVEEVLASGGGFGALRRGGDLPAARRLIPAELIAEGTAIGSEEQVVAQLQRFTDAGATHFFVDPEWLLAAPAEVERVNGMMLKSTP